LVVRQSLPAKPNSRWVSETHNERHSKGGAALVSKHARGAPWEEIAVPRDKPDYISCALAGHSLWNTLPSVSRALTLKVVAPLGT
jgi:hypothetical protein